MTLPRLLAIAIAFSLSACQPQSGKEAATTATPQAATRSTHAITGTAIYLERIQMPPGASLQVRLIDNQLADTPQAVLAQVKLDNAAGPPYAFTLPYDAAKLRPDGQYGLLAGLYGPDGKLWFVTDTRAPVVPTDNTPVDLRMVRVVDDGNAAAGDIRYWQCGEVRIGAALNNMTDSGTDRVTLSLSGRRLQLPHAVAASGARYADAAGNEFWTKGDSGTLTLAGEAKRDCKQTDTPSPWDEARKRGVGFRAVGSEPGWYVEVGMGEAPALHAQLDYGARKIDIVRAQPLKGGSGFSGKTANGTAIELRIERKPCSDAMSGERFDASAELKAGGQSYRGCGAFLAD
ncbi:YbaY family lipoprotein [Lysobacter cavernae]|uniref:YbaY family lipoprotein n=1 Tax=Lysobacter cavernae TaxID=1685901 RepID=A0ABV7RSU6_9GAMM